MKVRADRRNRGASFDADTPSSRVVEKIGEAGWGTGNRSLNLPTVNVSVPPSTSTAGISTREADSIPRGESR